jgi:hypothetical protein
MIVILSIIDIAEIAAIGPVTSPLPMPEPPNEPPIAVIVPVMIVMLSIIEIPEPK